MSTSSDDSRWDRPLAGRAVPEVCYKADLELHDRSEAFSSELLKLALAGIAALGFLLSRFPEKRLARILDDTTGGILFAASVVAFALAVASALLQRFYASGSMFHHLHAIKLSLLKDPSVEAAILNRMRIRHRKLMQAQWLLKATAWLLVAAALLISTTFLRMMFLQQ